MGNKCNVNVHDQTDLVGCIDYWAFEPGNCPSLLQSCKFYCVTLGSAKSANTCLSFCLFVHTYTVAYTHFCTYKHTVHSGVHTEYQSTNLTETSAARWYVPFARQHDMRFLGVFSVNVILFMRHYFDNWQLSYRPS